MFYNKNIMDKKIIEYLCAKDEQAANAAAKEFIKNCNTEEFKTLCEKMEFLFDFVRENVYKRLKSAINENNYKNIINLFQIYSPYFDDFFPSVLAKYANENLTDEILELLNKGDDAKKTYCAGYFSKIPDTVAKQDLINNLETEFEPLFLNCAAALSKMEAFEIAEKYKNDLKIKDDFVRLKAVKFLTAYGDKNIIKELIEAMSDSGMSENIAGEIVNLISTVELLETDFYKGAILFNNLINGLGEILPLNNIFYYEVYDAATLLLENNSSESALILVNLKNKISDLTENDEYIFDLDKNTKNEIFEIKKLLLSKPQDFWTEKIQMIKPFIKDESPFLETALEIVKKEKLENCTDNILQLVHSNNETVICEAIETLKELGKTGLVDKTKLNIKNENIKAIVEQLI